MSKPAILRERTRYKYASEEEAYQAKLAQTKESHLRNKAKNTPEYKEAYNKYQREYRERKKAEKAQLKLEQEARDKQLAQLLAAQNIHIISASHI
jgi:hypothetical protein